MALDPAPIYQPGEAMASALMVSLVLATPEDPGNTFNLAGARITVRNDGSIIVEAKAPELWSTGIGKWMDRWFGMVNAWTQDDQSWIVHNLEYCCDLQGVSFEIRDAVSFPKNVSVSPSYRGGRLQSITCGSKSSETKVYIYNKTAEQRARHGNEACATYRGVWEQNAYDDGLDVWRIEIRRRGRSLRLEEIDVTDPDNLRDSSVLARVWGATLQRCRLRLPTLQAPYRLPDGPEVALHHQRSWRST